MAVARQPDNYGMPWTRDELILAFDLYCRIPFHKTKASTPEVKALAKQIARSPAAVARKLGNFGAFDPELKRRQISGLAHGSKLDRQIWDEFHHDWPGLVLAAAELSDAMDPLTNPDDLEQARPQGPSERQVLRAQRIHQTFFRDAIVSSYNATCCVTGITISECLIASHIVPWSKNEGLRADPTNGLCLSATFDRLFDTGLMTVTNDLTVRFADRIHSDPGPSIEDMILVYDGRAITRPTRFLPSKDCLEWHHEHVFGNH